MARRGQAVCGGRDREPQAEQWLELGEAGPHAHRRPLGGGAQGAVEHVWGLEELGVVGPEQVPPPTWEGYVLLPEHTQPVPEHAPTVPLHARPVPEHSQPVPTHMACPWMVHTAGPCMVHTHEHPWSLHRQSRIGPVTWAHTRATKNGYQLRPGERMEDGANVHEPMRHGMLSPPRVYDCPGPDGVLMQRRRGGTQAGSRQPQLWAHPQKRRPERAAWVCSPLACGPESLLGGRGRA